MKELSQFTTARVGLGRAGNSLPTKALLEFQLAHARARDAVHFPFDGKSIQLCCERKGWPSIAVRSAVPDRVSYLRRPDLGRRLSGESQKAVAELRGSFDVAFILADGLSALAVQRHAVPLMERLLPLLPGWTVAPIVVVELGRVAIGDEIGQLIGAAMSVVLIGERPGLSSPDSMGAYLTWRPERGKTDAERNCLSNIRAGGLGYESAAARLALLMNESRNRKVSGIRLKESGASVSGSTEQPRLL